MIPVTLADSPRDIPNSVLAEKEEFKYSISIIHRGPKVYKETYENDDLSSNIYSYATFFLAIKRHLRSNIFSLKFKFFGGNKNFEFQNALINGVYFSIDELKTLKNKNNSFTINPDSGLKGFVSDLKKLTSIVLVCKTKTQNPETLIFRVGLNYHKNTENKKVNIANKAIDLQSVNDSNFVLSYNSIQKKLSVAKWNTYNHLIFNPLPMKNRIIENLYDIYSYNDTIDLNKKNPNPENIISDALFKRNNSIFKYWSEDISLDKDINYHGGVISGLQADKNSEMDFWFKKIENKKHLIGIISIKNSSYYDFHKKKTIIEPHIQGRQGYIFPLNKKGELNTNITFDPNSAYKKLKIYRQYKIENKVLDVYEGLVSLKITNPPKLSWPPTKTMIFDQKSFKKVILNDLSLKSLERISNKKTL